MIINGGNLQTLGIGYKAVFEEGMGMAPPQYLDVAMEVPSTNAAEEYGWLGELPGMREWVGDRVLNNLKRFSYTIRNRDWEQTVEVDRNDINDDNLGVYAPRFRAMGRSTAAHPNELVFALIKLGFATRCYDGQNFSDTAHPVIGADGVEIQVANTDGGTGQPWFLFDSKQVTKPIIFQRRQAPVFTAMQNPEDEGVFMRKRFRYGVDSRDNVGFGFWQFCWGSKQPLDGTSYAAARAALSGMKGDNGRPLGIMPDTLLVPPSMESAGRRLLNSEQGIGGITNEWKDTAKLIVSSWLA